MTIYSENTTRFQTAKSPQEYPNGAGGTARARPARASHNAQVISDSAQFSGEGDDDEQAENSALST